MQAFFQKLWSLKNHYLVLTIALAIVFATVYNWAFWSHVSEIYTRTPEIPLHFKLLTPVAISSLMVVIFVVLFSYRYVLKPVAMALFIITSAVSYMAINYKVIIDMSMMENVMQTNISEASSYFSWSLVLFVIGLGLIPALLIFKLKINYESKLIKGIALRVGATSVALGLALAIVVPNYQLYSFIGRENHTLLKEILPVSYIVASVKYTRNTYFPKHYPYVSLGDDAQLASTSDKPKVLFFVVGETARASNFGSLGYERNTNEYTKSEQVINFSKVRSCATATAQSVPCMFSDLKRDNFKFEIADKRDNLIDILAKANVDVVWLENDGGCKGVCKNIKTIEIDPKANSKLCKNGTCYDEIMIEHAKELVANVSKDTVVFFHLIGSHGPKYYERYPENFKKFTPDCNRADVENCTLEEVRNAYDNTIAYTDFVLFSLIEDVLEQNFDKINPALFYISDHGESLGENGLFLHGTPYMIAPQFQTHIPMQLWLPRVTANAIGLDKSCLSDKSDELDLSHDNVFATILGFMQIKTKEYQVKDDAFNQCRIQPNNEPLKPQNLDAPQELSLHRLVPSNSKAKS